MNKIATDLEQSKKLAEILPLESADMYWWPTSIRYYIEAMDDGDFNEEEGHIRAWSLSALMAVLPHELIFELKSYRFKMCTDVYSSGEKYYDVGYQGVSWLEYEDSTELVDACYNLIIKLHERDLL